MGAHGVYAIVSRGMDSSEMMGCMAEEGEKATAALREAGWWGVTLEVHVLDDHPNGIGMVIKAADVQGKRTIRVDAASKDAGWWGVRADVSDEGRMILFHTSAAAVDRGTSSQRARRSPPNTAGLAGSLTSRMPRKRPWRR